MMSRLPTKLNKQPLVDASFEIRFDSSIPVSNILPGHLFTALGGSSIERLPHADIPQQIKDFDQNLKYLPMVRLSISDFNIAIGDKSIIISCTIPYLGWIRFKSKILDVLDKTAALNILGPITRYSLKYTDILDKSLIDDVGDYLSTSISIGDQNIHPQKTLLRTEITEDDTTNILQIAGNVTVTLANSGKVTSGVLIEVDTVRSINNAHLPRLLTDLDTQLNSLHAINKKMFFDCLSETGLATLEPTYE